MTLRGVVARLSRQVRRLGVKIPLFLIIPIEALDARMYMRIAIPLLRFGGVIFNGVPRYISSRVYFDDFDRVTIGEHSVLSRDVILLTHDYSVTNVMRASGEAPSGGDVAAVRSICIGSNVFVGWGSIMLPGTVIEDDVVVGAGSVVRGRVATGAVVVGNPAKQVSTVESQRKQVQRRISEGEGFRKDE